MNGLFLFVCFCRCYTARLLLSESHTCAALRGYVGFFLVYDKCLDIRKCPPFLISFFLDWTGRDTCFCLLFGRWVCRGMRICLSIFVLRFFLCGMYAGMFLAFGFWGGGFFVRVLTTGLAE